MLNDTDIVVKRSSRKRSRDGFRSNLTPSRKKASSTGGQCQLIAAKINEYIEITPEGKALEYCSDNEDLFGGYDSILGDSSFLAKLDDAEKHMGQLNDNCKRQSLGQDHMPKPAPSKTGLHGNVVEGLTDSILVGCLEDDSFQDLPSSQIEFQQQVCGVNEVDQCQSVDGRHTSTPLVQMTREAGTTDGINSEEAAKRAPKARRSMANAIKMAMLGNAATSSSCAAKMAQQQKDMVVTEEISIAVQTIQAVATETDLGPFFGLPSKVKDLIGRLRGIDDLYEWQKTCLTLESVEQRRNLIYSLPTSGGKTLVAEILIFKEIMCRKKDAVFILPYVSLVQEKVRGLASFGLELDFLVEEYAGSKGKFPPIKRRHKNSLYITTIEKGHSLVNSLIETSRLDGVGLVVVDELHMLGDGSRGAVLEMTLAKVLHVSPSTQIIGMSATLGNVGDLQGFLKAENYTNDFRPVQLIEYVKLKDSIYEVDSREEHCLRFSRLLNYKYSNSLKKMDPDHIVALVTEVIPSQSCLVFCPTKKNCENLAGMICKYLARAFLQHKEAEKATLLKELRDCGNGAICPVLKHTVPYGLAYHHSGLTSDERRLVEEAYSAGVLCLLTCTSTLAAGINLPARRVVLRSPYIAADFLKRSQYKQMVGRAGRAGIDSMGESILVLQDKDRPMAEKLLSAPMEKCYSNLLHDGGKGLLSLILSLIGLNVAQTLDQLRVFLSASLLGVQQAHVCPERSLADMASCSVETLREKGLITFSADNADSSLLLITKLGRASYKGSVDLTYSSVLYRDLSKGLEGLLLNSFLHLVYLVTPYDMVSQCKPDWMIYFRQFTMLTVSEQRICAVIGVPESFVARKAAGQTVKKSQAVDPEVACRLYLALVLHALLRETDLWAVAERFQLTRGFLQTLLNSSSAFCSCVLHFSEELEEFWPYKALLLELTRRLTYCVQAELIPLMEVTGVMEARAKQLFSAGYKTLAHLANAEPRDMAQAIENLSKRQANQIVASAKMLLQEKAEALQEEVDDLLTKPTDLPSVGS